MKPGKITNFHKKIQMDIQFPGASKQRKQRDKIELKKKREKKRFYLRSQLRKASHNPIGNAKLKTPNTRKRFENLCQF